MGGQNLVRVHNVVVATIFDFMTVEDWESRNSNPYGRCEGKRRNGGRGRRRGEKNMPARYHCSFGKLRMLANGAPDWCGIGK